MFIDQLRCTRAFQPKQSLTEHYRTRAVRTQEFTEILVVAGNVRFAPRKLQDALATSEKNWIVPVTQHAFAGNSKITVITY